MMLVFLQIDARYVAEAAVVDFSVVVFAAITPGPEAAPPIRRESVAK